MTVYMYSTASNDAININICLEMQIKIDLTGFLSFC